MLSCSPHSAKKSIRESKMWWRRLGFNRNPYFGDELDVSEFSNELFVGRKTEARSLLIDIAEDSRALVCIGGISGSGKTSFINHCQYLVCAREKYEDFVLPDIVPCITKIQLHDNEDFTVVLLKILSSLIASHLAHCSTKGISPPPSIMQMRDAIDNTVSNGGGWGGGASAFGFGINVNRDKSSVVNDSPLTRETSLLKMIKEIIERTVTEHRYDGAGVVINNIETLSEKYLLDFVNYARDSIFNLPGMWWYLSGPKNLGKIIEGKAPRLRGFLSGQGVDIEPLEIGKVIELLELRRQRYALHQGARLPIGERVVELLYKSSAGDLRFLFNICANIVRLVVKEMPSVQLNEDISIKAVALLTRRNLSHYLEAQTTSTIVRLWLAKKFERISASDFRDFGYDDDDSFGEALTDLANQQLLWRDLETPGKSYFTPRGYLQLGILSNIGNVL